MYGRVATLYPWKKDSIERRYYISSTKADAVAQLAASRAHWAIENKLHWSLDVVFKEDSSLVRTENAAENMGTVRKIALNILRSYKTRSAGKDSVPLMQFRALTNDQLAFDILSGP